MDGRINRWMMIHESLPFHISRGHGAANGRYRYTPPPKKTSLTSLCPRTAAAISAVVPSLSLALTLALPSPPSRNWTISVCPSPAAAIKAVICSSETASTFTLLLPTICFTTSTKPLWEAWISVVTPCLSCCLVWQL